jgi:flagellar biosynthesis protein FliR
MSIFNFNVEEMLTFFAVLVRYSTLFSVLPFVGDRVVPAPIKILLSLMIGITLFPVLVASGQISPRAAGIWGASASGIVGTLTIEVLFGLVVGYSAKLVFDGISFGANLVGNFMGFATASTFDPHQESQTQVVAQIQTALAMLIFLSLDGHHLMLRAALDSYAIVGIGRADFNAVFTHKIVQASGEIFSLGLQMSAPVVISLFAVNVAFGVMGRAMPQFNIFAVSTIASAFLGLVVMFLGFPEFQGLIGNVFSQMGDRMDSIMMAIAGRK